MANNFTAVISNEEINAIAALSNYARADLAYRIKAINPFETFDLVEGKPEQIICPFCGSGSHGNKNTGITPNFENGVWLYHCFAGNDCEGTMIDIIAQANNLSARGRDFFQVLAIGAKLFNLNVSTFSDSIISYKKENQSAEILEYTAKNKNLILESQKNLPKLFEGQDTFRGFSFDVLQAFGVGYLESVHFPDIKKSTPAVVIPNDLGGVYFRSIEEKAHKNKNPTATTTIYLPEKDKLDLFVTEGFFNGLTLFDYARLSSFGIISTGGTSGQKNFMARLKQLRDSGKNIRVIVAFDNDTNLAGQKAAAALLKKLKAAGFIAYSVDITKIADFDLNNLYQKSTSKFLEMFSQSYEEALNAFDSAENQDNPLNEVDTLKFELQKIQVEISDFESEKIAALENLKNVETFNFQTCFSEEVLKGAAFASLYDKNLFVRTRRDIQSNKKERFLKDWLSAVKEIAENLSLRAKNLKDSEVSLGTQIDSVQFAAENEVFGSLQIPQHFNISAAGEILKDTHRGVVTICRSPIIITHKFYSVDTGVVCYQLAFKENGKWLKLPPIEQGVIADNKKIVAALASFGVPVNSTNANAVIDWLDAFMINNQAGFSKTYTTRQFGWHNDGVKDIFLDPRRDCTYEVEGVNFPFICNSNSQFARALSAKGSLEVWKHLYFKVKDYPLARFIVAACIAAPLLKVFNLRNFILYLYGKTRAGKTSALLFGLSAVGSESMLRSLDATKNGLTGAALETNDYVLAIDEKQVADKRIAEQLQTLIYALANGIERTKMNKDSSLREVRTWRCITVMTGETKLTADNVTGGANTRALQLNIGELLLPAEICAEIRTAIKDNHGLAFQPFIEQIFEHGVENLRENFLELVAGFKPRLPSILPEYLQYVAAVAVADSLLNLALGVDEYKAQKGAFDMAVEVLKIVPTTAEISDSDKEKDMLLGFISAHNANFIGSSNFDSSKGREVFGKFDSDKDFVYLLDRTLKKACNESGYDYRKVAEDLVADRFFVPADTIEKGYRKPRPTVKERIGDTIARCYRIPCSLVI